MGGNGDSKGQGREGVLCWREEREEREGRNTMKEEHAIKRGEGKKRRNEGEAKKSKVKGEKTEGENMKGAEDDALKGREAENSK